MKHLLVILLQLVLIPVWITFGQVSAQGIDIRIPCPSLICDTETLVNEISNIFRVVTPLVFGGFAAYYGVELQIYQNNPEKLDEIRLGLIASVIGLAIVVIGPPVFNVVSGTFTGTAPLSGLFGG